MIKLLLYENFKKPSKTQKKNLKYEKNLNNSVGYVDKDWGSDKTDFCCQVAQFHGNNKQKTVALSSSEASNMALTEASKEAIYLRNLLGERLVHLIVYYCIVIVKVL